MNRSKKYLRKAGVDHEALLDAIAVKNEKENKLEQAALLADKELFSVNVKKDLKVREKLAKDRFKENQEKINGHLKSKTEQLLLKRLREKNPPDIRKKVEVDEFADIWAEPAKLSKSVQRFKDFSKNSALIVKAVIEPTPGQSFNPTSTAHKKTL